MKYIVRQSFLALTIIVCALTVYWTLDLVVTMVLEAL